MYEIAGLWPNETTTGASTVKNYGAVVKVTHTDEHEYTHRHGWI